MKLTSKRHTRWLALGAIFFAYSSVFAGETTSSQTGCEQVYLKNFAQLSKAIHADSGKILTPTVSSGIASLGIPSLRAIGKKAEYGILGDITLMQLLAKNASYGMNITGLKVITNDPLAASLLYDATKPAPSLFTGSLVEGGTLGGAGATATDVVAMSGAALGAGVTVGGTIFGGSILSNYSLLKSLVQAKNILDQARKGGGKDLSALQDGLAKDNSVFSTKEMSREKFRQMVLALDEADHFCTSVIGDTPKEMNQYLSKMSDKDVRVWSDPTTQQKKLTSPDNLTAETCEAMYGMKANCEYYSTHPNSNAGSAK